MPNANTVSLSSKVVRCETCGSTFRNVVWKEGTRCPRCRSPKYMPLPVVGQAIDYALADRSQGYAFEDIRFAKIAQWAGFISAAHYQEAFKRQNELVAAKTAVPPIGDILTDMRALNKVQHQFVIEYRLRPRPNPEEKEFARLAVQGKFVTQDEIDECLLAQEGEKKMGRDPAPLACILYEKRHMQENHIQAALEKQAEKESGLKHEAQEYVEENTVRPAEKVFGVKGSSDRKRRLAGAGLLGVVALLFLGRAIVAAGAMPIATICTNENCRTRSVMPYDTAWPAACPECGVDPPTVYPRAICTRCAAEHVLREGGARPPACEQCGARDRVTYITRDVDEQAIREAAKQLE